jgi:5-methylcytosine-specific restriction endonuclease McrA
MLWVGQREVKDVRARLAKAEKKILTLDAKLRKRRRHVSQAVKMRVIASQRGRCEGCDCDLEHVPFDIDHIVGLADGGCNCFTNLQALCTNCHAKKTRRAPSACITP